MTIGQLIGLDENKTDFNTFWHTAVNRIGLDAIMSHVPFSVDALKNSYLEDTHFNTSITPLRMWDRAAGVINTGTRGMTGPFQYSGGLKEMLARKGATSTSLSECVCLMKVAAEIVVRRLLSQPLFKATGILWDTDTTTAQTLPSEAVIPNEVTRNLPPDEKERIIDAVSEWLSKEYAYCASGFTLEQVSGDTGTAT